MTAADRPYEFGKNWTRYVKESFDDERLEVAKHYLLSFIGRGDLRGSTFSTSGAAAVSIQWRLFGLVRPGSAASIVMPIRSQRPRCCDNMRRTSKLGR